MPKQTVAARTAAFLLAVLVPLASATRARADASAGPAPRFTVASFNVENYLLADLQARLRAAGLDLPRSAVVHGADTNIQVALATRLPIRRTRALTNDTFLLDGRRHRVARGFLEAELEVTPAYRVTLLAAHLKSKRATADSSEADLRENEARLLRGHVDELLRRDPSVNLVVCGDLNDTPDSRPIRILVGTGLRSLVDARPSEPAADGPAGDAGQRLRSRRVTWTHHFGQADTYARIDYLLLSRGLAHEWLPEASRIGVQPDWGLASDHRPVAATFVAEER